MRLILFGFIMFGLSGCGSTYTCLADEAPMLIKDEEGRTVLIIPCKGDPEAARYIWPKGVKMQDHR